MNLQKSTQNCRQVLYTIFFNIKRPFCTNTQCTKQIITGSLTRPSYWNQPENILNIHKLDYGGICLIHENASTNKRNILQQILRDDQIKKLQHSQYLLWPFVFPKLNKCWLGVTTIPEVRWVAVSAQYTKRRQLYGL